ncbi:MAG TPA: HAD-IA family hydrolase [Phycisphaerae bacterium]|nr:HAD-IA family hydrolase [Phycisphaerae bacterium]
MSPALQLKALIFDMDGTLVEPLLDFAAIRAELEIPPGEGIIEAIDAMPPEPRRRADRLLLEHELSAARRAKLMPNAAQVVQAVRDAGLKTALLTRNAAEAMHVVLERFPGLRFDLAWSREQGPIKPEPDGILRACRTLGAEPGATGCVGDYRYDIIAANAAGAVSILLAPGARPAFAEEADFVIRNLKDLLDLLGI